MNLDRDASNTDEYFVTALQIFDCCGGESTGTLRVDALMEKFAPFIKTNKAEYSYLKSLLDPEQCNPEINVSKLARALHEYSESQKSKVDLDESFNLRVGHAPHDSDSGISTDGFHLLEELQCELREKAHLAHQLRSHLDYTDRHHEEAVAILTAERDSLRTHLHMAREENTLLGHVRRDYEDACDRLTASEQALKEARRELEVYRKKDKVLEEQVIMLENEKLTLQGLLSKSKAECHRINEMYASRQSALLEQNETLRTEHADLSTKLQDQEEYMQQIIKEKVLVEMELRDMLNKSNQTKLRLDHSIDVSYSEDQVLTALDTLNSDSRFGQENHILDEESFLNELKEDQGRATNVSLFDEIRLSFCNKTRPDFNTCNCMDNLETSFTTIGTQTDEGFNDTNTECRIHSKNDYTNNATTQTETDIHILEKIFKRKAFIQKDVNINTISTQTDLEVVDNNNRECGDCPMCLECDKHRQYSNKLETDLKHSHDTVQGLQVDLDKYEENLNVLQKFLEEGNERNNLLQNVVRSLQSKLNILEAACSDQKERIDLMCCDTCSAESQTAFDQLSVSTQVDVPCADCEKRNAVVPHRNLRKYFWDPLKCLFQAFAVVCFVCAVSVLYGVTRRWNARCERDANTVPWRWFDAQDMLDLLFRIEYVADVPM